MQNNSCRQLSSVDVSAAGTEPWTLHALQRCPPPRNARRLDPSLGDGEWSASETVKGGHTQKRLSKSGEPHSSEASTEPQPVRSRTTRAHRLATMTTVASTFMVAVYSIFGGLLNTAPRARASAPHESRKSRKSRSPDTGSDIAATFSSPASRGFGRAAPILAVIVLAALFTTAHARWRPILAPGRTGRSRPQRANAGRLSDHGQLHTQHQTQRCDISPMNNPRTLFSAAT